MADAGAVEAIMGRGEGQTRCLGERWGGRGVGRCAVVSKDEGRRLALSEKMEDSESAEPVQRQSLVAFLPSSRCSKPPSGASQQL